MGDIIKAKLTIVIPGPRPKGSIVLNGKSMLVTSHDSHLSMIVDLNRKMAANDIT